MHGRAVIAPGWPILAVVALGAAGAGASLGYRYAAAQGEARLARAHAEISAERERAAREAALRLARAEEAARAASARLAATEEKLHATDRRLRQALAQRARADHLCLSGDTRRLLDDALDARADRLPETAGGAAAAAAAPAADSGGSAGTSERAIAAWIAEAVTRYELCRARIEAIRAWQERADGR